MSRPSSSVPHQCAEEGAANRVGRSMWAGSCGAIHGANRAEMTKITTNTRPVAARGLWRAVRRNEMAAGDIFSKTQNAKGAENGSLRMSLIFFFFFFFFGFLFCFLFCFFGFLFFFPFPG